MTIETKIKEVKKRLAIIESFSMCGAENIIEYKELKKKLKKLVGEDEYSQWFEENKQLIKTVFKLIFDELGIAERDSITFKIEGSYAIIDNSNSKLQYYYLSELLRRYDFNIIYRTTEMGEMFMKVQLPIEKEGL